MFSRIHTETQKRPCIGWVVILIIYACLVILLTGVYRLDVGDQDEPVDLKIDPADTAWMLISCALVTMMTLPGVALYYSSFSEYKNQLHSVAMIYIAYALVTVLWTFWGYALAFGEDRGGVIGNGRRIFLQGLSSISISTLAPTIPEYTFCMYQLTFAAITVALAAGGMLDRMKFISWIAFIVLWLTIVYVPIAHWVWGGGFLSAWGVLDFAGGTVVHISSGIAALITSLILGKPKARERHLKNTSFVVIATSLIFVGWFGFDAGSALASNAVASTAFINTNLSACTAALAWVLLQAYHTGKPTLSGLCDGTIAGLVCITPAAGYVNSMGAFILGLLAVSSYGVTALKENTHIFYDPANAFCIHFVGGTVGALFVGVYADPGIGGKSGFMFGNFVQVGWQLVGICITIAYTAIITAAIMFLIKYTIGLRVDEKDEVAGLDNTQLGEYPYKDVETTTSMQNLKDASASYAQPNGVSTLVAFQTSQAEVPAVKIE